MKSNLIRYPLQRKRMFNEGLTPSGRGAGKRAKKKSRESSGSQEFYREASNEVAEPLSKNPEVWIPTDMTFNA